MEAEEVLIWYNKNNGEIDIDKRSYTFKNVFDAWEKIYIPTPEELKRIRETHEEIEGKIGSSNARGLLAAAKKFKSLYDKQYVSLRKKDFQSIMDDTEGGKTKKVDMRNLIMKLDKYAKEEEIITTGYGELLEVKYKKTASNRAPYSYEAINKIWEHEGGLIADIQLILLHTRHEN